MAESNAIVTIKEYKIVDNYVWIQVRLAMQDGWANIARLGEIDALGDIITRETVDSYMLGNGIPQTMECCCCCNGECQC